MDSKVCTKCGLEKSLADFPFRNKSAGTKRSQCRECVNAMSRKRYDPYKNREYRVRYKEKHPERVIESKRRWRKENHEIELERARSRRKERWSVDHAYRQNCIDASKAWKIRNAEQQKEYRRKRWSNDREQILDQAKKYRAKATDAYVIRCLKNRGFKKEQITPELIKAERALIKLKRKIRETV